MKLRAGFTMIELMMVLVILAILAAVAVPVYQSLVQRSKSAELTTAAGAIRNAVEVWRAQQGQTDFSGSAPSMSDLVDQDLVGTDDFAGMQYFDESNLTSGITISYETGASVEHGEGIKILLGSSVITDLPSVQTFTLWPDGTTTTTKPSS